MDLKLHARLGQQAADVPLATGRSDDHLPPGRAEIGHGPRQPWVEFHLIDERQYFGLTAADFGKVPL